MAATQCKAWTYTVGGYPSTLRLSSVTPPSKHEVKPNHILVKIHSTGLNPVDIQMMNLIFWPVFRGEYTAAADFAGTVIQGGDGSKFSAGDEVFGVTLGGLNPCGGTMAEIAHINLGQSCVVKKPKEFTFTQAAGLGCVFLTAQTTVKSVQDYVDPSASKKVAILGGSSSSGIYTIWLAKRKGWTVLSTCSGKNADFVRDTLGADVVVDYTKQSVRDEVQKFKPDAVIDCVGGTEAIGLSKRYVTIVGDKTTRSSMGGPLTYYISFVPRQWIRWTMGRLGLIESYDIAMMNTSKPEWLAEAAELPTDKIFVDSVFSFENVKNAYERLNTGRARGKVVVDVIAEAKL